MGLCSLCGKEAVIKDYLSSDLRQIDCLSCGVYKITRECMEDLPAERKLTAQLIKVSAFTRNRTIHKEPIATLFIDDPKGCVDGYSINQIINTFPTLSERIIKALSNLRGLSKHFGDAVSIESNDSPVFYSEVREEQPSLMMMEQLVKDGFVTGEIKFPTKLTVTLKGMEYLDTRGVQVPVIKPKPPVQSDKLDGLHPKVVSIAKGYYESGHFRSAVLDTYVALNNEVQHKSGLATDGSSLMQKAFSKDSPVLKVAGGSDPQLGAMWLFSGAMMGVRNVLAHDHEAHPTKQEALEWLNFASALFRILDNSSL